MRGGDDESSSDSDEHGERGYQGEVVDSEKESEEFSVVSGVTEF